GSPARSRASRTPAHAASAAPTSGTATRCDHTASANSAPAAASHPRRHRAGAGITRHAIAPSAYETTAQSGQSVPHAVTITGDDTPPPTPATPAAGPYSRRSSRYTGTTAISANTYRVTKNPGTAPNARYASRAGTKKPTRPPSRNSPSPASAG